MGQVKMTLLLGFTVTDPSGIVALDAGNGLAFADTWGRIELTFDA